MRYPHSCHFQSLDVAGRGVTLVLVVLLRQSEHHAPPEPDETLPGAWTAWREDKKGLGVSLTLTGFVAIIAGIALHFALRTQFIEATIRLGYIVGLTGVILSLIGLILVF